jgi:hypothetical protein
MYLTIHSVIQWLGRWQLAVQQLRSVPCCTYFAAGATEGLPPLLAKLVLMPAGEVGVLLRPRQLLLLLLLLLLRPFCRPRHSQATQLQLNLPRL